MKNLSTSQELIWLTQNIYTRSTLYNVGGYAFIEGDLQESILMKAIEEVLKNIDVIEVGYHAFNESTLSDHVEFAKYDIAAIDFSDAPDPALSCLDWIHGDINECFDVSRNLLKVRLLKSSENSYYWYTKVHHLIFDGYSMALFFNNVSVLYSKYISNDHETITNDVYQYSDFIDDGNEYKVSDDYRSDKIFWLQRLSNLSGVRAFQSCLKSNKTDSLISKRIETRISRALYNRIDSICKSHNCTVFHYFIASLFVLNRCYNNETPLIGLPVFNRRNKKFKSTFGTFVNMLPFSVSMKEGSTFLDLLNQVRIELRDCYKHQRFPLYDILQELDGQGNIYNITFSYQRNSYEARLGNSVTSINYVHSGEQQEDLVFHLLEYSETEDLTLSIDYRSALFSADVIANLLSHFNNLLYSLVNDLDQPINELNYLGEQEKHQLLVEFNATVAPYALNKTVVDLFNEQVVRTPDAICLMYEDRSLSYRELNDLTNRLAHYLRQIYDVSADDLIGIRQERSEWIVISLLAVLKSGGAYVPIDPSYPQDRIDYIIADSNCKVVLDEKELDKFRANTSTYSGEGPVVAIEPANLAYIIYTSGSTGRPKGVMITHSNVYAFMDWCKQEFAASSYKIVLGATSICFDLSVFEIFYTLASGKQLRLLKDALSIPEYLNSTAPLLLNTVPSVVNSLLSTEADLSNVTVLNMAGEPIPAHTISQLDCDRIEVRNLYGPSEDTTYSTVYRIKNADSILIGKPVSNTRIYILNGHHHLQPIGVVGEICLSGDGLARGYLNKEDLTAEKFVPHPFIAGARLYKTGDLGKWQADGNIAYLGRKDDQVKIRGYRIELGEITQVLQESPGVTAAVVTAIKKGNDDNTLVAYVVSELNLNVKDLRNWLASKLPQYMVPAHFVQLDALPLLPNGKLNKKALPAPEGSVSEAVYEAPRNRVEVQLVQIWQQVLKRERIGVTDSFFELGGHSLKAISLLSVIHKEFGKSVNITTLFQHPTIRGLAEHIGSSVAAQPTFERIPRVDIASSYPVSNAQLRIWLESQEESASIAYHIPLQANLYGVHDLPCLKKAIVHVVDRHEMLRTVFRFDEDLELRQYILSIEEIDFEVGYNDFSEAQDPVALARDHVTKGYHQLFDLEAGPLIRATILKCADDHYMLYCNMHHIICDAWSVAILKKEVLTSYEAFRSDQPAALPVLNIQYKDYTAWYLQQLNNNAFRHQQLYWTRQLSGELPLLNFPTRQTRPPVKTYNGSTLSTFISADITRQLKAYAAAGNGSLFMVVLGTLHSLLSRYTGAEDIIIGSPFAVREHIDLESQVGFYINTLPLRNRLEAGDTFDSFFKKVRNTVLEAQDNQQYPFDQLVTDLRLKKDTSRNPLFDVMLVVNNQPDIESGPKPADVDKIVAGSGRTSKFDLLFFVEEADDLLLLGVEYNTDLFEPALIRQFIQHYKNIMVQLLANHTQPIASINYIFDNEGVVSGETYVPVGKPLPMVRIDESVLAPTEYVAPQTEVEKRLIVVWMKVLGVERVGITDDFFELGGHSLHITRMLYEINKVFDIRLQIKAVFASHTVQELAQVIEAEIIFKNGVAAGAADQFTNEKNSELWEI